MIKAEKRTIKGRKVKSLRNKGKIPAVIYSKDTGSIPITLDFKEAFKQLKERGEGSLVDIQIKGGGKVKALIQEAQIHPVTDNPIHIAFLQVKLTEKITAPVEIEVIGESLAIKDGAGILLKIMNEVNVECFPADLPEKIEVDISTLKEVGDTALIKDLKIDRSKVEIKADESDVVLKIDYAEQLEIKEEKTEEELIEEVQATKELSEEEKAKRTEEENKEKSEDEKEK